MMREIKSVWGYARTARHRVTSGMERRGLPADCYLCRTQFEHRTDHRVPHEWHHKSGNPFDNRKRNLVPLCCGCHSEVHGFALQTYLLAAWRRLGMRIGHDGLTYETKSGRFFIKSPPGRLLRKRPKRLIKLAEALKSWARELARASRLTKARRIRFEHRLLLRNLREAIRVAVPTEKVIMQRLLKSLLRA